MGRTLARAGIGLLLLAGPAFAEAPSLDAAAARAQALERLRARMMAERAAAQDLARRIAATPMRHLDPGHDRTARTE